MICSTMEDLILDYLDNALSGEERRLVEAHVDTCAGCREFFDAQRNLDASLATALARTALSGDFARRMLRRVDAEANADKLYYLPYVLDLLGYTAVAAVAGFLLRYLLLTLYAQSPHVSLYAAWALGGIGLLVGVWIGFKEEFARWARVL